MYLEHFGLQQAPFRITPNTGFFFTGGRRGPTLEALEFAVLHDEGIVKISGEVGSGKTMLCRMMLSRLPEQVDAIYLSNPTLGPDDLLRLFAEELGVSVPADNAGVRLLEIQKELIARYASGRRVVTLVDEAHAMPAASLEQVRLLSNLETANHKLLQIALFGQPELDEILARKSMRQLRDRVTQHFRLAPLADDEVEGYLEFRLRTAGYRGPRLFAPAAVRLLARASEGLSRRVNVIADKALLSAYSRGEHLVTRKHVREAIRDCEYPMPQRGRRDVPVLLAVAAALALAIYLLAARGLLHVAADEAPAAEAGVGPVASPVPRTAPMVAPTASPALPSAGDIETTRSTAPLAETATPGAPPALPAPESPTVPAELLDRGSGPLAKITLGPVAASLQAGTPEWVANTPEAHWFIQLRTVDGPRPSDIDAFVESLSASLDRRHLRVYVRDLGWAARVGVIYGDFASRDDAGSALRELPTELRNSGAYLRQVRGLR
ncbi:MAG: AAA family ATPase [Rhodocyclaceae bacterium]|nr:AAA family ATPase [Rhodocyclaceae bacterium]